MKIPYLIVYTINGTPVGTNFVLFSDILVEVNDDAKKIMTKIYAEIIVNYKQGSIKPENIGIQSITKLR